MTTKITIPEVWFNPTDFSSTWLPLHLFIYGSTVLLLDLYRFFSFLILYTVGRTPWMGDQPVASPLTTHRATQTQNKRIKTSMPWVGFVYTIPGSEDSSCLRPHGHCLKESLMLVTSNVLHSYYEFPQNQISRFWNEARGLKDRHDPLYCIILRT
jgi:hypothetical protein